VGRACTGEDPEEWNAIWLVTREEQIWKLRQPSDLQTLVPPIEQTPCKLWRQPGECPFEPERRFTVWKCSPKRPSVKRRLTRTEPTIIVATCEARGV
ncbi:MAG: hypothetical protein WBH55_09525, partial [Bacteroidota bacterium]